MTPPGGITARPGGITARPGGITARPGGITARPRWYSCAPSLYIGTRARLNLLSFNQKKKQRVRARVDPS